MSESDAVSTPPATAGEILRSAREQQGVHLAVLAASLKVPQRKLELLESNRHDELADVAFARALALSVCRALKIDAEPVLARLPQPGGSRLDHMSPGLNQPFRDRDRDMRRDGGEWSGWLSLPVIGALLLVVAAVAIYVVPESWSDIDMPTWSGSTPEAPGGEAPRPEARATQPPQSVGLASPPPQPAASEAAAASPLPQGEAAASAPGGASVETVFDAPRPDATAAPVAGGLLGLRATAESWIEVRDAGGQVLLSRTFAAGEAAGVNGRAPLTVTIGNAEGTEVTFRGRPVPLRANRDNVARLELQ